ncbi:PhzF family phenazine biosynthesis protein [Aquabacterium sp. J223]|uniref:PhzF family phenazine biosynthesis protein n=1 Tax=Aquabacterium sp. J223 TaxID=2898431 RepID=UPI0021AD500D|nr:PhzF family phenazine biosynthesis protein [Aquabacterium sp. J223]UUX96088.1 PhzF family phenazine biosynthesis protein [Aquabacterium sp. J223]
MAPAITRRFDQVDVFAPRPLAGNPLAVVHDAVGLSDEAMQAFAGWTRLSETTFLLPPTDAEADYRVRIFTPGGELPFAGHPTLGSCHAWLAAGGRPRRPTEVVQQCAVGRVRVRREDDGLAFAAPPVVVRPADAAVVDAVLRALGLSPEAVRAVAWLDSGFAQLALELDSADRVLGLQPDHAALKTLAKVGVVGRHRPGGPADVEVRFFAAMIGIPEDPVTGSLQANLARWLMADGRLPRRYVAAQGRCVGADGRVVLQEDDDGTLWVGGRVQPLVEGRVLLQPR